MGIYNKYPYTDFHELNLDWVIENVETCVQKVNKVEQTIADEITETLQQWLADGTLADIIGDALEDLSNRITAVNTKVDNLISRQLHRNFIWIGDSYGMRHEVNWISRCKNELGGIGFGDSGRGFLPTNDTFLMSLQTLYSQTSDPASITDIVICGGWNDARAMQQGATITDLDSAIRACYSYMTEHFPNAFMWLGFMAWHMYGGSQYNDISWAKLQDARNVYNNGYHAPRLRHLNACQFPMLNPANIDSSGFHPNETTGAYELGYAVMGELFGHHDFSALHLITASDMADTSKVSNVLFYCAMQNGIIDLKSNAMPVDITAAPGQNRIMQFNTDNLPFAAFTSQTFLDCYFAGTINGSQYNGYLLGLIDNSTGYLRLLYNGGLSNINTMTGTLKISKTLELPALGYSL